jgi:hypothetical protein
MHIMRSRHHAVATLTDWHTGIAALVILVLAGCGHAAPGGRRSASAHVPASLNGLSASQVVDDFKKAQLPAVNPQEITSVKCLKLECLQAITTDTVTVFKFPATDLAQRYIGSRSDAYQIEDLVLEFAPTVTDDVKQRYERVVERAAA